MLAPLCSFGAGGAAFQFLMIQPGARAIGMGGTGVALEDDGYALYWNPAGAANAVEKEVAFTHVVYLQDMNYDFISFVEPLSGSVTLEAGALGLFASGIPKTQEDLSGNLVDPGEKFSNSELAGMLSFAWSMDDGWSLGITGKSVSQSIGPASASGYAVDLGALWQAQSDLKLGLSAQNIGAAVNGDDLPTNIKLGCAYDIPEKNLKMGAEADYPLSGKLSFGIGAELSIKEVFSARLGYNTAETGGIGGIRIGFGVIVKEDYSIDYALMPYGDLGIAHQISLSLSF
jgi:hypothetical protein